MIANIKLLAPPCYSFDEDDGYPSTEVEFYGGNGPKLNCCGVIPLSVLAGGLPKEFPVTY